MKFQLLFSVFLIFLSCSKNSVENEIQENGETAEEITDYWLFINPTNGGTIEVSSHQGIVNETDLARVPVTSFTNTVGVVLLTGKLADKFDQDTEINISVTTDEGFKFIGWTINTCIKCYWVSRPYYINKPSFTLNINSNIFLTANFENI